MASESVKLTFGDTHCIESHYLLNRLVEITRDLSTGPWKADIAENAGRNWCIAAGFGESQIDGKQYILTTDGVHASEYDGDAKTDAEGLAELRNLLPRIIETIKAGLK